MMPVTAAYFVTGKFLLNAGPNGSKKSGLHT
jgi:hypothetical protein